MKKYVITGALGHISRPIVTGLVKEGHHVTVITSNAERVAEIESMGAQAAVGSVTDMAFLTETFKDADAAYLMIPPNFAVPHFLTYAREVADNYITAIKGSRITHIVQLSSIGAHLRSGAGPIDGLAYLEDRLSALKDMNVKVLRPGYFFYNFYTMLGMIQHAGIMGSNFGGGEEKMALSHHEDIAARALDALSKLDFSGYSIDYVISDERQGSDVAATTGKAIGKDGLPWVEFADEDAMKAMLESGLSRDMAENYVAMGKAFREGRAQEHYQETQAGISGKHKLEDFLKEFVVAYAAQ